MTKPIGFPLTALDWVIRDATAHGITHVLIEPEGGIMLCGVSVCMKISGTNGDASCYRLAQDVGEMADPSRQTYVPQLPLVRVERIALRKPDDGKKEIP